MPGFKHRVTSILSADVVGYSRLVAQNDEMTVRQLRTCRDIIKEFVRKHHGRVFGGSGDSFMIEYDSPIEAVRCAIAVQGALRQRNKELPDDQRMWLRTGVNIGDVIEDDGVLHGTSINIAVRLQEACPSGSVLVSDLIYDQLNGQIEVGFRPIGELSLKNIPDTVRILEVITDEADVLESAPALAIVDVGQPVPGFESRPAVAVLPFENQTNDPAYDYLSDGFSEDLATGLSHLRWFPMIDRNSSFAFRGAIKDLRRIGKLLGARYLLLGGMRFTDDRLRLTTRLIEGESGHVIWSERYDVRLQDLLTTLDEVAECIVGTMEGRIERAEQVRARARRQSRLDVWGLIWRGRWHLNRLTRADAAEARRLFEEALAIDPQSPEALIHLTWWTWYDAWTQRRPHEQLLAYRELALRTLRADELDSRAQLLVGGAEILLRNLDVALRHINEAIRLNPSLAYAHAQVGSISYLAGRPQEAIDPLKKSLRLNPHDYYVFYVLGELAIAQYMLGDWEQAIDYADKALGLRPAYWYARTVKIGALARRGDHAYAAEELGILRAQHPNFSRTHIEWLPFKDRKWTDYLIEGITLVQPKELPPREVKHPDSDTALG
jgi:adenylate cyclase